MSNWMKVVCPKCGDGDYLDVTATLYVRLTWHGSDADESADGSHEYDEYSPVDCQACGWHGYMDDLKPETEDT
jgi:predicted nucleic-acid-binding Zn-ribbon protein